MTRAPAGIARRRTPGRLASLLALPAVLLAGAAGLAAAGFAPSAGPDRPQELLVASYSSTRALWRDLSAGFAEAYRARTGHRILVRSSHGGSASQARAVIHGLEADIVALALAWDVEAIARAGLVRPGWEAARPGSSPYTSAVVLVVREGNPKRILDWRDLVRPGVEVVVANPRTSGGSRWTFLAAWGQALRGGSTAEARRFVARLYANVPVLDADARGATMTFAHRGIGDVLLAWESEARLAAAASGADRLEIVYPGTTILAEPRVAIVDATVDRKGTREPAEALLVWLATDDAQAIIARHGYRPRSRRTLERYAATLPPISGPLTLEAIAGSWAHAQEIFFDDGAIVDQASRSAGADG